MKKIRLARLEMREWGWVIAAVVLLAAGFFASKMDLSKDSQRIEMPISDCDLRQGSCEIELLGDTLLFEIRPNDIRILQPLTLSLGVLPGSEYSPDRVSVEFEGINMDMGYNRVFLEPESQQLFTGQGMLPACTAKTMNWLIHLLIQDQNGTHDFKFSLMTGKHGS